MNEIYICSTLKLDVERDDIVQPMVFTSIVVKVI